MIGGIQVTHQNVGELALFLRHQVILVAKLSSNARIPGECCHQFANTFLDSFGDDNFALAGQQFDSTHLAHVHAHWVGGAAGFVFNSGECGSSLGSSDLIR